MSVAGTMGKASLCLANGSKYFVVERKLGKAISFLYVKLLTLRVINHILAYCIWYRSVIVMGKVIVLVMNLVDIDW